MKKESLNNLLATNEKERRNKGIKIEINEKDVKEITEKMKEELK